MLRAARIEPDLPLGFQDAVWRRIESTEIPATRTLLPYAWLEQWVERLLVPRFALASLALMLVAGGLMGVINSAGAAKQQAQERYLSAVAPNSLR